MGGMAAVTFLLDQVAALTKGGTNLLRDAYVFPMGAHAFPTQRVTAFTEFIYLLEWHSPHFSVETVAFVHRRPGVFMTGDAGHPLRSMFRSHPGLKERRGSFYVAAHTESGIDPSSDFWGAVPAQVINNRLKQMGVTLFNQLSIFVPFMATTLVIKTSMLGLNDPLLPSRE